MASGNIMKEYAGDGVNNNPDDGALWYKDAIIYQLHVKTFFDSNADGIGDFRGLTEKLDYVSDLGANTLWLLPFYPSPLRDDGYDISDYRAIHPDYGTRGDFHLFLREAHQRGFRVITELVINHTSDEHPWFQAARRAPRDSAKRNFYVWSDSDKKFPETRIIFADSESSNWSWDPLAQQYYWHRFFHHQPDLNHNNPDVVKAMIDVMCYWFDLGVDGLRLDAIPYLCVREGTNNENLPETHLVLKQIREAMDSRYQHRVLLAEANQWPEDAQEYFGDSDECHMAFHFPLMPRMFMAVAQEDRHPIVEIMNQTPSIPDTCQWAIFLRNHDELTLEMVTDRERDYIYERYAADPRMRINVGIRRRLASLMENDFDKIKLMNSLLMSMPGSPIIYYGDEIGMGDNFFLGDRNAVRTPMQWSPDRNAGFSRADPQALYLPPIMDPVFGYDAVNVEAQKREPASLLNWMKRMIAVRKANPAFGRGSLSFLNPGNRKILAYIRSLPGDDTAILCVANLARSAQPVELDLAMYKGRVPVEMLGQTSFPPIGDLPYLLTLPSHGFYWFRLAGEAEVPAWHEEILPQIELPMLVLFDALKSFFVEQDSAGRVSMASRLRSRLELEVLPNFLTAQRWMGAKSAHLEMLEIGDLSIVSQADQQWLWLHVKEPSAEAHSPVYSLPLTIVWGESDESHVRPLLAFALARVRQQAKIGLLCDATADERFVRMLVEMMLQERVLPVDGGDLTGFHTSAPSPPKVEQASASAPDSSGFRRPRIEGSNTTVIVDEQLFVKFYRRSRNGINPEVEMGRFLTDVAGFPHVSPLLGAVQYNRDDGSTVTLASMHAHMPNQGDAWTYSLEYLKRFYQEFLIGRDQVRAKPESAHAEYRWMMEVLGQRTGELHLALAQPRGEAAFEPEAVNAAHVNGWAEQVREDVMLTFTQLRDTLAELAPEFRQLAQQVLDQTDQLLLLVEQCAGLDVVVHKTRYHGDFHLGQVLLHESDFILIDFEGEPDRPFDERRAKHSPLRDVAGLLRSISYAGLWAMHEATGERSQDLESLQEPRRAWERVASAAFLKGYRRAVTQCSSWPREEQHAQYLIQLFVLEKSLYEIRYELAHRPAWLAVPLRGLLESLQRGVSAYE